MPAINALSFAMAQIQAAEYQEKTGNKKRAKTRRKPLGEENRSTVRASAKHLLQEADVLAAVRWRLAGVPTEDVESLAEVLQPLARDFREDRPEVMVILSDLRYPGDRRGAWTLACAVLAQDAASRNDFRTFWAAGVEVVKAMQQGRRGTHGNRVAVIVDALDDLISAHLANTPHITANVLFDRFTGLAGMCHEVLADVDHDRDELVCQLDPENQQLSNITRADFARRVERASKRKRFR